MKSLTHLDLFSGIGGFSLAFQSEGFRTIAFCEIDDYAQRTLIKNFGAVMAESQCCRSAQCERGQQNKRRRLVNRSEENALAHATSGGTESKNSRDNAMSLSKAVKMFPTPCLPNNVGSHGKAKLKSILTSEPSTAANSGASQCLPLAFPVSPQVRPGSEEARRMTAGSGRRLCEFYASRCRIGLSLKTLLESLLSMEEWSSSVCLLRWKVKVTPFNRLLFQLAPWTPDTDETECGLWPSMQVRDKRTIAGAQHMKTWTGAKGLCETMGEVEQTTTGALNPQWVEWLMGYPSGWTDLNASETPSSRKSSKFSRGTSEKSK